MSGMCRRGAGQELPCIASGPRRGGLRVFVAFPELGGFQPYPAVPVASTCVSRPYRNRPVMEGAAQAHKP